MSADTANLIRSALDKPKQLFSICISETLVLSSLEIKAFEKLKEERNAMIRKNTNNK